MNSKTIDNVLNDDYLDKRINRKLASSQSEYWWIHGSEPDKKSGRMRQFLLGAYNSYDEASNMAETKRLTSFTIVNLPTRDMTRAGQLMKARRLQGTASMQDVFQRVAHKNVGNEI